MKLSREEEDLKYKIALSLIPRMGCIRAKKLVAYCGSVEAVFSEKKSLLEKIPGIGKKYAGIIHKQQVMERAEEEIMFIQKNKIKPLFYLDPEYPKRLTHCEDSPVILYYKGNADLNTEKVISIVGTREATDYGKGLCEKLIADLSVFNPIIVSGLAYGIDICAHKAALENGLQTIGVFAHGLNMVYPSLHTKVADKMIRQGGLLTDYMNGTNLDPRNFPSRNRIVAGMADATIVIESKKDGGSLITADIANSYNRDVFAFPGKVNDLTSEGCNNIIKQNKAALIQSAADVIYIMGWEETKTKKVPLQKQLFIDLKPEEEQILNLLKEKEVVNVDDLSLISKMPMSKVSSALLVLEFAGLVRSLPGKMYKIA